MARLKHFGNSLSGVSGGGDSVVCIFLDGLGLWATQRLSQAALVTKRWCSGRSHDAFQHIPSVGIWPPGKMEGFWIMFPFFPKHLIHQH